MRVLLRLLAPLLGLGLAAAGALLAVEVTVAWLRTPTSGVLVGWPAWRTVLEQTPWTAPTVTVAGGAAALLGLVLLLVGLLARRGDIALTAPSAGMIVTTSPKVLARLVGRRVRAADEVAQATVTASARTVSVRASGRDADTEGLTSTVAERVRGLLDELPLARRPRVSVRERKG